MNQPGCLMPTAAVLAHWQPAWSDMSWAEAVSHVWTKEPERMAALTESIREDGVRQPVKLGTDGRVWDGHHRLSAICRIGIAHTPVTFAALSMADTDDRESCPTCSFPGTVHALWCPSRPVASPTADDVLARIHAVFDDPSRAWFAKTFWTAFALPADYRDQDLIEARRREYLAALEAMPTEGAK